MFKKLFGKKEESSKTITVYAPLTGELVQLSEVPDPVFSQQMMGDGLAIKPAKGEVVAPIDGEVLQMFPTKHAIGLKAANGAEVLLHIGIETVGMKGEGFETFVKEGDRVKVGDTLVKFDMDLVNEKATSTITPIILTNSADLNHIDKQEVSQTVAGETPIMKITSN